MKQNEVTIDAIYAVKVSGTVQPVRITEVTHGKRIGWLGTNLKSGRQITIRSAAKLRYQITALMMQNPGSMWYNCDTRSKP